ncbi:hypothetical protein HK096_004874, partial [Nowakowskiella sp. JEL0078]
MEGTRVQLLAEARSLVQKELQYLSSSQSASRSSSSSESLNVLSNKKLNSRLLYDRVRSTLNSSSDSSLILQLNDTFSSTSSSRLHFADSEIIQGTNIQPSVYSPNNHARKRVLASSSFSPGNSPKLKSSAEFLKPLEGKENINPDQIQPIINITVQDDISEFIQNGGGNLDDLGLETNLRKVSKKILKNSLSTVATTVKKIPEASISLAQTDGTRSRKTQNKITSNCSTFRVQPASSSIHFTKSGLKMSNRVLESTSRQQLEESDKRLIKVLNKVKLEKEKEQQEKKEKELNKRMKLLENKNKRIAHQKTSSHLQDSTSISLKSKNTSPLPSSKLIHKQPQSLTVKNDFEELKNSFDCFKKVSEQMQTSEITESDNTVQPQQIHEDHNESLILNFNSEDQAIEDEEISLIEMSMMEQTNGGIVDAENVGMIFVSIKKSQNSENFDSLPIKRRFDLNLSNSTCTANLFRTNQLQKEKTEFLENLKLNSKILPGLIEYTPENLNFVEHVLPRDEASTSALDASNLQDITHTEELISKSITEPREYENIEKFTMNRFDNFESNFELFVIDQSPVVINPVQKHLVPSTETSIITTDYISDKSIDNLSLIAEPHLDNLKSVIIESERKNNPKASHFEYKVKSTGINEIPGFEFFKKLEPTFSTKEITSKIVNSEKIDIKGGKSRVIDVKKDAIRGIMLNRESWKKFLRETTGGDGVNDENGPWFALNTIADEFADVSLFAVLLELEQILEDVLDS